MGLDSRFDKLPDGQITGAIPELETTTHLSAELLQSVSGINIVPPGLGTERTRPNIV
jgi:hypothetical protein